MTKKDEFNQFITDRELARYKDARGLSAEDLRKIYQDRDKKREKRDAEREERDAERQERRAEELQRLRGELERLEGILEGIDSERRAKEAEKKKKREIAETLRQIKEDQKNTKTKYLKRYGEFEVGKSYRKRDLFKEALPYDGDDLSSEYEVAEFLSTRLNGRSVNDIDPIKTPFLLELKEIKSEIVYRPHKEGMRSFKKRYELLFKPYEGLIGESLFKKKKGAKRPTKEEKKARLAKLAPEKREVQREAEKRAKFYEDVFSTKRAVKRPENNPDLQNATRMSFYRQSVPQLTPFETRRNPLFDLELRIKRLLAETLKKIRNLFGK